MNLQSLAPDLNRQCTSENEVRIVCGWWRWLAFGQLPAVEEQPFLAVGIRIRAVDDGRSSVEPKSHVTRYLFINYIFHQVFNIKSGANRAKISSPALFHRIKRHVLSVHRQTHGQADVLFAASFYSNWP